MNSLNCFCFNYLFKSNYPRASQIFLYMDIKMPTSQSSIAIPIPISSPTKKSECVYNFFDPTKASPPNEFLRKLQYRIEALETGFGSAGTAGSFKKPLNRNRE